VRRWLSELSVKTLFIEPSSLWEIGYAASFTSELQDGLLNLEIFHTLVGSAGARGAVEETLQHGPTTQRPSLSSPRFGRARKPWAPGFAPLSPPPTAA
jgi:hypothetical protein